MFDLRDIEFIIQYLCILLFVLIKNVMIKDKERYEK